MCKYNGRQGHNAKEATPLKHIYCTKLQNLCRIRFGNHWLPDSDDGRAMLTALLCLGLTDESATEDAPWCAAELDAYKRQARHIDWWKDDVGKLLGLTFDEWKEAKLWILRPVDKSEAELDAWRKEQCKESSRKSKQKARVKEKAQKQRALAKAKAFTPREAAIYEMLVNSDPLSVSEMTKRAQKSEAFKRNRYLHTGWVSGPPPEVIVRNVRNTVHRTLKQLEARGAIEIYKRAGARGMVTFASPHYIE